MKAAFRLVAALAGTLVMSQPAFSTTDVVIGELDWPGAVVIADVLEVVMTDYLDAKVSSITATEAALYEAMNKGDGSVDVVADMWSDHQGEVLRKYVYPGSRETIILNKTPYLGEAAIFVPTYVSEKYNVKSLADLAKPEVAKLFDIDNAGKGQLWIGAEGWESTNRFMVRMKSSGVAQNFDLMTVDQTAFLAKFKAAYDRGQPIAFYYWTPEWIFDTYKLTKLEEPAFDGFATEDEKGADRYNPKGCYTFYQPATRPDWLEASSITCAEPSTRVHVAYSKALANRAPKIAQFLAQVSFEANTVGRWIRETSVDKKDPMAVARDWVAQNPQIVKDVWLKGID